MMVTSILFALLGPCLVFVVVLYYDTILSLYVWCSHTDSSTAVTERFFIFSLYGKYKIPYPPQKPLLSVAFFCMKSYCCTGS